MTRRSSMVQYLSHNRIRSEEHTSELQSPQNLVCRLLLEKKKSRENAPARVRQHALRRPGDTAGAARLAVDVYAVRGSCGAGVVPLLVLGFVFFLKDAAPTKISPLPLPAALPI